MILDFCVASDALLDKDFEKSLRELIGSFGYEVDGSDEPILGLILADCVQFLLDSTNQAFLPAGLKTYLLYMVMGKFYTQKVRTSGVPADFNFQGAVNRIKQIQEGGDSVVFADDEPVEDKFLAYMDFYASGGDRRWLHYRRLTW